MKSFLQEKNFHRLPDGYSCLQVQLDVADDIFDSCTLEQAQCFAHLVQFINVTKHTTNHPTDFNYFEIQQKYRKKFERLMLATTRPQLMVALAMMNSYYNLKDIFHISYDDLDEFLPVDLSGFLALEAPAHMFDGFNSLMRWFDWRLSRCIRAISGCAPFNHEDFMNFSKLSETVSGQNTIQRLMSTPRAYYCCIDSSDPMPTHPERIALMLCSIFSKSGCDHFGEFVAIIQNGKSFNNSKYIAYICLLLLNCLKAPGVFFRVCRLRKHVGKKSHRLPVFMLKPARFSKGTFLQNSGGYRKAVFNTLCSSRRLSRKKCLCIPEELWLYIFREFVPAQSYPEENSVDINRFPLHIDVDNAEAQNLFRALKKIGRL